MANKPEKTTEDFRPAIPSRPALRLARAILPLAMRRRAIVQIEISADDIKKLRSLRRERVVLTPNHPTNNDPAIVFELSRRARMPFHYLCCREAFDDWGGAWGKLIQRIGAYSVVRGTIDRESFRYTRGLLARPGAKLVIFPEGEVYSQNDSLLPFQSGAIQLAAWGREEARKTEPNAQIFLLPCAVKYHFTQDVRPALRDKLKRLEKHLELKPSAADIYSRLRRVSLKVLQQVEREYGLNWEEFHSPESHEAHDLSPRFDAAKNAGLERAAKLLEVEVPRGTLPEKMRVLLHAAEVEMHSLDGPQKHSLDGPQKHDDKPEQNGAVATESSDDASDNDASNAAPAVLRPLLQMDRAERVRRAWKDLRRLSNWIAVYDGYVRLNPSTEHIAEVVQRLEVEVFGEASIAGPRIATLRLGEPIPLPEEINRKALPSLTLQLELAVGELLHRN